MTPMNHEKFHGNRSVRFTEIRNTHTHTQTDAAALYIDDGNRRWCSQEPIYGGSCVTRRNETWLVAVGGNSWCIHCHRSSIECRRWCQSLRPVHTSNNVERVYRKISSFRLFSSFRQSRNKLNMFNLFQQCRNSIRLFRKNPSTCSILQCCFDIVAGVDGALLG